MGCTFLKENLKTSNEQIALSEAGLSSCIPESTRRHPMKFGRMATLWVALIVALTVSCGGPEEKKMKFFNKGKLLYERGEYVHARLEFRNALQIDRTFAEAHYMLGLIALHEQNWRAAYSRLHKAVEQNPGLLDAQAALGRLLLIVQKPEEAREKVDLVLATDPGHQEALLVHAGLLAAAGDVQGAGAVLESILKENPANADACLALADIQLKQGATEEAMATLQGFLARNEQNKAARLFLARASEKEGNLPMAEDAYRTLVLQDPEDDSAKLLLAGFYARTNRDQEAEKLLVDMVAARPDDAEPRRYLAQFHELKRQDEALLKVLQEAIDDMPDEFWAYEMLGTYYVGNGKRDKAVHLMEEFTKNVQTGPSFLKAQLFLAHINYREKNLDRALELAEKVLKENPADAEAHVLKGNILSSRGNFSGAIAEYRAVLRQEPQNVPVSLSLARAHLQNKEISLAEDTYKRILKTSPNQREARLGLAEVYGRKGDLTSARAQLETVLEVNPDDTMALMALGDAALLAEDTDAAEKYFSRLAVLQPNSPVYNHYKKGMVKRLEGQQEEAASLFEKALEADPDFLPALNQLTDMFVKDDAMNKALNRCREQVWKSPDNPGLYVLLGKLQMAAENYSGAGKSLEKALEIDPNSLDALLGLAQLAQLSGSLDEALTRYQALRKRHPENVGIALVVGTLLEGKGDFVGAKDVYEDILKKNPDIHAAANNLAFYYAEHEPTPENLAEGERLVAPLLQQFKGYPNFADTAAWIYYRQGEYAKARDTILSVKDKIENRPAIHYHLGMIYLNLDQKAQAIEYLELALASDENFAGRKEATGVLKQLR
jgi:tetratricopeptide (TPR) repeat protein